MPRILSGAERDAKLARGREARAARRVVDADRAVARAKRELVEQERSAAARAAAAAAKSDATAMDGAGVKFFASLATGRSVSASAKLAGVSLGTVYHRRKVSPAFAAAWALAADEAADVFEDAAFRRGVIGVEEPVFQGGRQVGSKRVYSDYLLMEKLKASRPDKYRDKRVTHVGAGGGAIVVQHEAVARLTDRLARLGGGDVEMRVGPDGIARVSGE